jgi:hypothetical protein
MRFLRPLAVSGALLATIAGCAGDEPRGEIGRGVQGLGRAGPWLIPEATRTIGDSQYVEYTGAGAFDPDDPACTGGLEPGTAILGAYLESRFPQIAFVGGYSCRAVNGSSTTMSVHGTGRALDLMISLADAEADNDLGDPIGNWLIENAETLGVQYVIWDEWTWMADRPEGDKDRAYAGAHPHHDHLHVELGVEASMQTEDWFSGIVLEPALEGCEPLGPAGGVIDELDRCFQAFGEWSYWRSVDDAGYGGSLLWTDAWQTTSPSNWARYTVRLAEPGLYEVEVFLAAPWAVYSETRYAVRHDGIEHVRFVDQGAHTGWVSLGELAFAADGEQWIAVYDDVVGPVASDQHIAVDAIRLRRTDASSPDGGIDEPPSKPHAEGDADSEARARGCAATGETDVSLAALALLGVIAHVRRAARERARAARGRGTRKRSGCSSTASSARDSARTSARCGPP